MSASPVEPTPPFIPHGRLRFVLAVALWVVCLVVADKRFERARTEFAIPSNAHPDDRRPGGNKGHSEIDFGGQWVMGRMILTGHGRELYHRNKQWEIVHSGFPVELEPPGLQRNAFPSSCREPRYRNSDVQHDAEALMNWFMGRDSPRWQEVGPAVALPFAANAIYPSPFASVALQATAAEQVPPGLIEELNRPALGGPLYPPIHGFFYAPLTIGNDPPASYLALQVLSLALTFVTGYAIKVLTRGRVWWSVATIAILLYSGYRGGLDLGQNHVLSLVLLAGGWALAVRGRDGLGGAVWGLMAFKPVWAVAFLLVPLVMGRWRFVAAMVGTAGGLILATLPIVGIQTWFDWLAVGREGSTLYEVNHRWIFLSRDLGGLIRRVMLDFSQPEALRRDPLAAQLNWGLWLFVLVGTVGVYLWRRDRQRTTGMAAGFLFLGAYLACFRFMYYDTVLSIVPVAILLVADRPSGEPLERLTGYWNAVPLAFGVWLILFENWFMTWGTEATFRFLGFESTVPGPDGLVVSHVPELFVSTSVYYAWDTFALLALWLWTGARVALGRERLIL